MQGFLWGPKFGYGAYRAPSTPNYEIKRTPEVTLRTNHHLRPAPLISALGVMNDFEHIVNHEIVVDYFGEWPDFNDCDVVCLHLESKSAIGFSGFRIELVIETPQHWLRNYVRVPGALVKIILDGVKQCEVSGYSYQNVISELRIQLSRNLDGISILKIDILPEVGVSLEAVCDMAVVESVVCLTP